MGPLIVKRAGPYEIWCGDIFDLPPSATTDAAVVYDRAALVAFPPAMQGRYAQKLMQLAPEHAPIVLVSLVFDPAEITGPPFPVGLQQIAFKFGPGFASSCSKAATGWRRASS